MPKINTVSANGPVIQDLRERAGLSRAELAEKIRRNQQTIRRMETRPDPFSRLIVCQVAKALEVEPERLILSEDDPHAADDSEGKVAA